jgi:hypothetical protein
VTVAVTVSDWPASSTSGVTAGALEESGGFTRKNVVADVVETGGEPESVTTAQKYAVDAGDFKVNVVNTVVTPVWGLVPDVTATTVVSAEHVELEPLWTVTV